MMHVFRGKAQTPLLRFVVDLLSNNILTLSHPQRTIESRDYLRHIVTS